MHIVMANFRRVIVGVTARGLAAIVQQVLYFQFAQDLACKPCVRAGLEGIQFQALCRREGSENGVRTKGDFCGKTQCADGPYCSTNRCPNVPADRRYDNLCMPSALRAGEVANLQNVVPTAMVESWAVAPPVKGKGSIDTALWSAANSVLAL